MDNLEQGVVNVNTSNVLYLVPNTPVNNFYGKLQFLKLVTQSGKTVPPHQFKKVLYHLTNRQSIC